MNKQKSPIFLTEHGVKKEAIDTENQVNKKAVAKTTLDDVNNQIITRIQNILEIDQNLINIDSLMNYLELFGFNINEHISLDGKNINNDKITYKYSINKEGEKIIKSMLTYQESKRIIEQKLESGINFTGLNKKLNYINQNSNKAITISKTYTKQELEKIQDIVTNTPNNENLLLQISDLITKTDKQEEYKYRLVLIQEVIISVNFHNISQEDLSNSPNYTNQNIEDTFSLYKAILAESKQTVKSNFDTISYSYTEENTAFIEKEKKEKEKIELKKQEKINLEIEENEKILKNEKNNKIRKNTILAGIFGSLLLGGVLINEKFGEVNTKPVNELTGPDVKQYANKLYDELILKENIKTRNSIKNELDGLIEEVFKFYPSEAYVGIIGSKMKNLLNNLGYGHLGSVISNKNGYIIIKFPELYETEDIKYKISENNKYTADIQFNNPVLYNEIINELQFDIKIAHSVDVFQDTIENKLANIFIKHYGKNFKERITLISYTKSRYFHIEIHDSKENTTYNNIKLSLPSHLN